MELNFKEKSPRGKKGPRQWYMNSGGWFPHPQLDIEAFNDLPKWRQREILETQRIFRDIPGVQAYEIVDPSTGKPYPNQKLAADYYQEVPETDTLPPIPPIVKFVIPNGISLAEFRRHSVEYCQVSALEAVQGHVLGLPSALAPQKPLDGVYAFIWRLARYHSGLDANVPVTAFWDLEDGICRLTGLRGGASEEVVGFLEKRALELVTATGGENNVATLRWARIMGRLD